MNIFYSELIEIMVHTHLSGEKHFNAFNTHKVEGYFLSFIHGSQDQNLKLEMIIVWPITTNRPMELFFLLLLQVPK